ncbi:hypothetical protein V1508DRAFT_402484 [Lipomyces doorenjongii]|uniref:uncharacterized protein n=1 Tax=Lipomyces doorenjongii TaxID=383834 RepID=UPI0034CF0939
MATKSQTLADTIQTVKAHLYARDYAAAFDSPEYLLAYAVRWSSSRALAYLHVLGDLCPHIPAILTSPSKNPNNKKNILCIGGGAGGEVLALATLANDLRAKNVNILAIDIAQWDNVFMSLRDGIRRGLGWDKDDENDDIAKDSIQLHHNDRVDFGSLDVITIMFTTNELFAQSKPRTLTLFRHITENCKPGTLLLVLESAGSYSHIQIGSKTFPVQFLLDHIMVDDGAGWERVVQDDSVWFRVQKVLKYPLELENMRFFLRLYRRK